jgi:hypothetical protein
LPSRSTRRSPEDRGFDLWRKITCDDNFDITFLGRSDRDSLASFSLEGFDGLRGELSPNLGDGRAGQAAAVVG